MNKLEYVNDLLKSDDLSDYIKKLEQNDLISPPIDLENKILSACYKTSVKQKKALSITKLFDIAKVACFTLLITIITEIFMNASYASTKATNTNTRHQEKFYKITSSLDETTKKISDFLLDFDLKGEN